jgi:lanthanide-dependent methanol dehydrogenase
MLKAVLCFGGCLLVCVSACKATDLEDIVESTLKKAIVKVDVSTNIPVFEKNQNICKSEGTGFLITSRHLVTASHVYDLPAKCGSPIILVKPIASTSQMVATVVDAREDVSILSVDQDFPPGTCALSFKGNVFGTQAIRYGIPSGFSEPPVAEHIRIGDQQNQFMPLVVMGGSPTEGGESGGPVINLFNVVGIIHGKHQEYASFSFMTVGSTAAELIAKDSIKASGHLCNPVEASTTFVEPHAPVHPPIFGGHGRGGNPGQIIASITVNDQFAQMSSAATQSALAIYARQFRAKSFAVGYATSKNSVRVARQFDPGDSVAFNTAASDVFRVTTETSRALQQLLWNSYVSDGANEGRWDKASGAPLVAQLNDEVVKLATDPTQWVMQQGNDANTRYSKLNQVNASNVGKLQVAWTFSTGVLRGHEGGPLVVGDVMYVHTPFPNRVYALDLNNDGKILWKFEPRQDPNVIPIMCCDTVNRGVAYADGKIFLHQADTTLVALDATTGKVVWSVMDGEAGKGQSGTNAPFVFKDKVLVGVSGGEFGVRGWISAYNIKNGKLLWRGFSEGPDSDTLIDPDKTTSLGKSVGPNSSTSTWEGDQWKIGGGTAWGWYSYDPQLNLVYYGSGNPSPWNAEQRPGDNRWSTSIWARDLDTGKVKWIYQMTPHDEWGYDGANEMILTDQPINGQPRKLLTHFDHNGFGYTLDRVTGELLVAQKFDPVVNWASKIDTDKSSKTYGRPLLVTGYSTEYNGADVNTKGICPASLGAKNEQPAAYSPDTLLFYVPTNHICMDYEPYTVAYTAGQPYVGSAVAINPPKGETNTGNFIAWDGKTGKIVWSNKEQFSAWGGALATAGGLVFYGTLEGYLKAVDAKTGKELYKFKTPSGIIGNVMTYEHG